jgi:hypothetical protein
VRSNIKIQKERQNQKSDKANGKRWKTRDEERNTLRNRTRDEPGKARVCGHMQGGKPAFRQGLRASQDRSSVTQFLLQSSKELSSIYSLTPGTSCLLHTTRENLHCHVASRGSHLFRPVYALPHHLPRGDLLSLRSLLLPLILLVLTCPLKSNNPVRHSAPRCTHHVSHRPHVSRIVGSEEGDSPPLTASASRTAYPVDVTLRTCRKIKAGRSLI